MSTYDKDRITDVIRQRVQLRSGIPELDEDPQVAMIGRAARLAHLEVSADRLRAFAEILALMADSESAKIEDAKTDAEIELGPPTVCPACVAAASPEPRVKIATKGGVLLGEVRDDGSIETRPATFASGETFTVQHEEKKIDFLGDNEEKTEAAGVYPYAVRDDWPPRPARPPYVIGSSMGVPIYSYGDGSLRCGLSILDHKTGRWVDQSQGEPTHEPDNTDDANEV